MWYFSWILGTGLACAFGIINAMWFELREHQKLEETLPTEDSPKRSGKDDT